MPVPRFRKTVIAEFPNPQGPAAINTFSSMGDINANGRPDFVACGRNGKLAWFENPGRPDVPWTEHLIDEWQSLECGGSVVDLTGNGFGDVIDGSDWRHDEIFWWENPGRANGKWTRRVIAETGHGQFHDTIIGDVTGDGVTSLIFTNQQGGAQLCRVPLPRDPRVSPWPGLEVIASELTEDNPWRPPRFRQPEEGLAVGDIDGDGQNELVCGTHWYKWTGQRWRKHKFAQGYLSTKVAIGDVDGDGRNEIVLAEGDPCIFGKNQGGKLGIFKPTGDIAALWQETILLSGLLDAHSLQLGRVCGSNRMDILVGEIGVADREKNEYIRRPPRVMIMENMGDGSYCRHIVDEGTGIHEALLVDVYGRGVLDIAGKPLHGPEKWNLHVYVNENGA